MKAKVIKVGNAYVIHERHKLLRWIWVKASNNCWTNTEALYTEDTFDTEEEANSKLQYYG